ncbi:MAG: hypothetical protein Hals2KO_21880 [Halioglobus sp.]
MQTAAPHFARNAPDGEAGPAPMDETTTSDHTVSVEFLAEGEAVMQTPRPLSTTGLLIAVALLALQGCKLDVKVPQGGKVVSADGSFVCEANETCSIDVVDLFFDQTFKAVPEHGYVFSGWRTKDGYLCGGESGPCALSTAGFEGNPELQAMLESEETFFLQPRFSISLAPCPDPGLVVSPGPQPHTH